MTKKIYLHFLILCGIWYQGFIGTFAGEEINKSSDFLVRQKRVVSYVAGEDVVHTITNAGYVVIVKYLSRIKCTGSILSLHVVISAASCIEGTPGNYQITSASSRSDRGNRHDVIEIRSHLAIVLLIVDSPFVYTLNCYNIPLHEGPLLSDTIAKVSGWGFNCRTGSERGTNFPSKLRSIRVPIMSHRDCVNRYRPHVVISETEVCTFDPERHCGHNDFGAGLVVDRHLAGVHIRTGLTPGQINSRYPDVFVILQHSDYRPWITSNLQTIEAWLKNGRYPLFHP